MKDKQDYENEIEKHFTTKDGVYADDDSIGGAKWFLHTYHLPEIAKLKEANERLKELLNKINTTWKDDFEIHEVMDEINQFLTTNP